MEPETSSKLKILIVDDNESIREVLTIILSRRGYQCESATTGREAMEKVVQAHFDVIITDVHMPEMDGITLTRELTRHFSGLPVMIMTGELDDDFTESAITAGAREVLAKPFAIPDFMVRLHRILSVKPPPGSKGLEEEGGQRLREAC